jgi:peptide/nickel transport system ATP-binding protein/oligopeptide transport system ATP-binding protein
VPENTTPLLVIKDLKKYFPVRRQGVVCKAVDGVSFSIKRGETLGMVGESGCGKSTLGRSVLRLVEPTAGSVRFENQETAEMKGDQLRMFRRNAQIVFQNPYSSLNPRMIVLDTVKAALDAHHLGTKEDRENRAKETLEFVGLDHSSFYRYPHEFSGGQRQRIVIARALVLKPSFIFCDEPVSALDVSVRAQVLNLMKDIQQEVGVAYLFVSHDLSVVRYISDRIAVMYLGHIVEMADKVEFYSNPLHPYSQALISAVPVPERKKAQTRVVLRGDIPSPLSPPPGCCFHTRCPRAAGRCRVEAPTLAAYSDSGTHYVACHLYSDKLQM